MKFVQCDDWLEWMMSQVNEVQQIRREAETVDSNSAEYGPKLFEIFELMRKEQGEISSKYKNHLKF